MKRFLFALIIFSACFTPTTQSYFERILLAGLPMACQVLSGTERQNLVTWCRAAMQRSRTSIETHQDLMDILTHAHDLMHLLAKTRRNPSKFTAQDPDPELPGWSMKPYIQASKAYDAAVTRITQQSHTSMRLSAAFKLIRGGSQQALYHGFKKFCAESAHLYVPHASDALARLLQELDEALAQLLNNTSVSTRGLTDLIDTQVYMHMDTLIRLFSTADIVFIEAHQAHQQTYLAIEQLVTDLWIHMEQERLLWYTQVLELLDAPAL